MSVPSAASAVSASFVVSALVTTDVDTKFHGTGNSAEGLPNGDVKVQNVRMDLKLKAVILDGSVPFDKFFTQFSLITQATGWDGTRKTMALAVSLRGEALAVLEA